MAKTTRSSAVDAPPASAPGAAPREEQLLSLLVEALALTPPEGRPQLLGGLLSQATLELAGPDTESAAQRMQLLLDAARSLRILPIATVERFEARLRRLGQLDQPRAADAETGAPARDVAPRDETTPRAGPKPVRADPVDTLVVDGCNFLGRARGYRLGETQSMDRLDFRLQGYSRKHPSHRIVVFYDGGRSRTVTQGRIQTREVSAQRDADDVLVEMVRGLPEADKPRCLVVTDDLDLQRRCRQEGARTQPVSWLEGLLGKAVIAEPEKPETLRSVDDWMGYFNEPPQRPPGKR